MKPSNAHVNIVVILCIGIVCAIEYCITAAYKHADGKKIDGRRVLVDVERARTVKGWLPRRLGEPRIIPNAMHDFNLFFEYQSFISTIYNFCWKKKNFSSGTNHLFERFNELSTNFQVGVSVGQGEEART